MSHSRAFAALALGAGLLAAVPALGGAHVVFSVIVGPDYAYGSLDGARASANTTEQLGCLTNGYPGGAYGFCRATSAAGVNLTCYTFDPSIIGAIRTIDSESYVTFYADKGGMCTMVSIDTNSVYKP
ncbi:MAG: hypothetical protein K8W52_46560 [Deltaproteobacteria bacterium]|nr:hypothetical protein [Deltaproteobacteria bacterium]